MNDRKKRLLWYLFASYGLFWVTVVTVLILIGTGILNVSIEGESPFLSGLKIFFSWTPTMAVYLFRKKIFPGKSAKQVFMSMFRDKLNVKLIFIIIAMEVGINLIAGRITAVYDNVPIFSQWTFSLSLFASAFGMSLVTGATGEESGWRGFLFPYFMEKRGCIVSGIYVGIIWGLWHLPLWLLSGYQGKALALYIFEFMACTIAWSVVMGVLFTWNRNLLIVTTIHFMINFLLAFFCGNDLVFQISIAVLYSIAAIVFAIVYTVKKKESYNASGERA